MEIDIESIYILLANLASSFLNSGFFFFIKFILAIYVIVLFVDMVLLLALRGLGGDIKNTLKGANMPLVSKKKIQKQWEYIESRLKLDNDQQDKLAILEADKLVDQILFDIGYKGSNMKERLESADSNQIEELDLLIEAHEIRNKIINDGKFYLNKEEVRRVMNIYREFLENLEII
ncbi:MAG: hypothetical protein UR60_C0038G0011 [Candidatus Moranbacteria bacterium GW2011_GWF2_34_56]|nr:MAG: hypothetical protein UR51_C0009G0047 [Candidatus Moranbacteria bacterium GW2011_GWF1_34_10]KKP63828.1 MAG: hypothetical protein UR60_C0038G0011 [Candidatus Moranbacteria bacterium GW2011_GWF2_34_56]HBI17464.1 hypothetical protein [Candidatus Moranbacteria bacterium]